MMVTVVYDNSEATELCAAQHLYLKPIAKLMIKVLLPASTETLRHFSNWEILDQLKSLIFPDQFTTIRLSKSTKNFIQFEGEAETLRLVQILKAKLHGRIIRLTGLKTDFKVVSTDAQSEWEHFSKDKEAFSSEAGEDLDHSKSPDSIYFEGLPCKWFAPKGSSGEKPCKDILRVLFESFGKIKNVDIPMLDHYRGVMIGESFGSFSLDLQTFEAFVQYQESKDFVKAMESLHGMKLMLKGDDGKALACNIKVKFDSSKHFSEGAIKRIQERLQLQELEEERKEEKKREEAETKRPIQFNSQESLVSGSKTYSTVRPILKTWKNKVLNLSYLSKKNKMFKHLISKSDKQQTKKMNTDLHKYTQKIGNKRGRCSPTTERIKDKPMNRYNHSFLKNQRETLKITLIRHNFLSKEEYNKVLYQRNHNKLTFYEKDKFTDYIVNQFQNPSYTHICLVPNYPDSQWKRVIHSTEDGVQINLSKVGSYSANYRPVQDVQGEQQDQMDNSKAKSSTQSTVHTPQKRRKTESKENVKGLHYKEADPEVNAVLPLAKENSHDLEKSPADELKSRSISSQSSSANINLEDFLEDISSTSECFSDEEKKEISLSTDSPDASEFNLHYQEFPDRKYDHTKFVRYNFRQAFRRPEYRMKCRYHGNENYFRRDDIDKFRKIPNLYHEGHRWKSSSSNLFHGYTREKFHETYHQYKKYRPPYMSETSYSSTNVPYKHYYSQRRLSPCISDYNRDTRRFHRVSPNYFSVRHARDDYIASRNNYRRSLYSINVLNESSRKQPYKKHKIFKKNM